MRATKSGKTVAPTKSVKASGQLNERELSQAAGGLLPAVGPAAKPLLPAV
jgi:hypothetical protein